MTPRLDRFGEPDNGWHIWVIHPDALRAWDALNKAAVESPLIVLAGLK